MIQRRVDFQDLLYALILLGSLYSCLFFRAFFASSGFHSASPNFWPGFIPQSGLVACILIGAKISLAVLCLVRRDRPAVLLLLFWFFFNVLLIYQPVLSNGGDELVSFVLFYFLIRRSKETPIAPFRLLAFHFGSVYLGNALTKTGALWHNGEAVSFFFLNSDLLWPTWAPMALPKLAASGLTAGTLVFEAAAGLFLLFLAFMPRAWQRTRERTLVSILAVFILGAVAFHGILFVSILLGFFPLYFILSWFLLKEDYAFFLSDQGGPSWNRSRRRWSGVAVVSILVLSTVLGNVRTMWDSSLFREPMKTVVRVFDEFQMLPPQSFFTPQPPKTTLIVSWRLDYETGDSETWSGLNWVLKVPPLLQKWPDPYRMLLLYRIRRKPETAMALAKYICRQTAAVRVQPLLEFRSLTVPEESVARTSFPTVDCRFERLHSEPDA